jgi:hypothetical protein
MTIYANQKNKISCCEGMKNFTLLGGDVVLCIVENTIVPSRSMKQQLVFNFLCRRNEKLQKSSFVYSQKVGMLIVISL